MLCLGQLLWISLEPPLLTRLVLMPRIKVYSLSEGKHLSSQHSQHHSWDTTYLGPCHFSVWSISLPSKNSRPHHYSVQLPSFLPHSFHVREFTSESSKFNIADKETKHRKAHSTSNSKWNDLFIQLSCLFKWRTAVICGKNDRKGGTYLYFSRGLYNIALEFTMLRILWKWQSETLRMIDSRLWYTRVTLWWVLKPSSGSSLDDSGNDPKAEGQGGSNSL